MTKFINSLGYSFNEKQITDNEIYEAAKRYKELDDRTKQQNIILDFLMKQKYHFQQIAIP